jgi:hypothetical protein
MFQAINLKLRKIVESRACYWLIAVAVALSVYEDIVLLLPSRLRLIHEMTSNEVVFMTCGIAFLLTGFLMFTHCLYVSGLSAREKMSGLRACSFPSQWRGKFIFGLFTARE